MCQAEMIVITPTWHTQPWCPQLFEMLIAKVLLLPKQKSVVKDFLVDEHPLLINNIMKLVVWKILGKVWRCQGFQKQLPNLLQELGENHHGINMVFTIKI